VLIIAGIQVPVMAGLLVEDNGRIPGTASLQYGPNCVNVGKIGASIVIIIVTTLAHTPASGVKV